MCVLIVVFDLIGIYSFGQAEVGSSKIPVGQIIAILAEEGDDLSSITVPAELGPEDPSSSQPKPEEKPKAKQEKASPAIGTSEKKPESKAEGSKRGKEQEKAAGAHKELRHSRPLFPSVARLSVFPTLPALHEQN